MSLRFFSLIAFAPLIACLHFDSVDVHCEDDPRKGGETRGPLTAVTSEATVTSHSNVSLTNDRIVLSAGIAALDFLVPKTTGPTTLAALDAHVCEWGKKKTCHSIDGTVDVASTCDPTACAWLDLSLHLPMPSQVPAEAFFYGDPRVLYREWTEQVCQRTHGDDDDDQVCADYTKPSTRSALGAATMEHRGIGWSVKTMAALRFRLPTEVGVVSLEELGAETCDEQMLTCDLVAGTMTVRAVHEPAAGQAEGRLDADLDITSAVLHGAATIDYREELVTSCHERSNGCGSLPIAPR